MSEIISNYDLLVAIVDKDQEELIIESCHKAKAPVYTAFTVQGSLGKKGFKLLYAAVELPKSMVMILTPQSRTQEIKDFLVAEANLDDPANGIILVLGVKDIGGFSTLLQEMGES